MTTIELRVPAGQDIPVHVEATALRLGLEVKCFPLTKYRESTHWHLRKRERKGTVEITWWPEKERFWISLRQDRSGEWVAEAVQQLVKELGMADEPDDQAGTAR